MNLQPRTILVGERHGRLVATVQRNPGDRRVQCRCDCGNDHTIGFGQWGKTQSCGCLRREVNAVRSKTHGMSKTPEYRIWHHMRERCGNPSDRFWKDYGGRGIAVCERWRDFANFYADMGPRPSASHSIDRIDNDRGYEPGNCRWATPKEQANNRRPRRLKTHCANGHEWAPENTYLYRGHRQCRTCSREWMRKHYRTKKGAAA